MKSREEKKQCRDAFETPPSPIMQTQGNQQKVPERDNDVRFSPQPPEARARSPSSVTPILSPAHFCTKESREVQVKNPPSFYTFKIQDKRRFKHYSHRRSSDTRFLPQPADTRARMPLSVNPAFRSAREKSDRERDLRLQLPMHENSMIEI